MKRLGRAQDGVFPYDPGDGSRLWACDYRDPETRRRRRKAGFALRRYAEAHRDRARRQALGLEPIHPPEPDPEPEPPMLFGALVDRFMAEYQSRSGSMTYYEQKARTWKEHLGSLPVPEVTPAVVESFRADREADGIGPTTIRHDLVSLGTLFRWAVDRGLAETDPTRTVKRPRKPAPDPRPLTPGELTALLDACPGWLAPIVELTAETGCDVGEAVRLTWERHVDRDRMVIRLPRAKTGVGRTIPYRRSRVLRRVLRDAWRVRHPSGRVFLHDGSPAGLEAAKTAMRRAWRRAGITKPRPWKSLRATFATRRTEEGQPVAVIAALMGLTTSHVFEHYVAPSAVHLEAAMSRSVRSETRRRRKNRA